MLGEVRMVEMLLLLSMIKFCGVHSRPYNTLSELACDSAWGLVEQWVVHATVQVMGGTVPLRCKVS